jgi:hypothetical protein
MMGASSRGSEGPEGGDGYGMSIRGKGYDAATGVEDDSSVKFPSGYAGQSSHAAEVALPDGGGRLDLDPDDPAFAVLQHEIFSLQNGKVVFSDCPDDVVADGHRGISGDHAAS